MGEATAFLVPIGNRDALRWILAESRMAFVAERAALVEKLRTGTRLFLYTTRGCFKNPSGDRGRVICDRNRHSSAISSRDPSHV
jgi:hypothetical protein